MASLNQYLLSRVSQECAETAQAFSKLFDYGLTHRHPVTKELAISKASQEVNDILGTIDLLQEVGVELFGIGNPDKRYAKKLKIFRNMQLSIDERCLILSDVELEKLNAMFPEERPLKQAPTAELTNTEETIRTLHMNHPELFNRDIHLDMLLEIARVKNVPLPYAEGSWQQQMQANPPHINSRPIKMLIGIEDTNTPESQWAELHRMAPEFFCEDGTIDLFKISIACRLLENKKKFQGPSDQLLRTVDYTEQTQTVDSVAQSAVDRLRKDYPEYFDIRGNITESGNAAISAMLRGEEVYRQELPEIKRNADGTLDCSELVHGGKEALVNAANGTVPHEDGTIGTVKTDGGIVTTL